ncbi:MAG TPA: adenylate/guanylate cyclase domain-containing protein [Stellaceae bacterium]|nr:adenylate/guanylate cyclase domain-containing protein [Stellaceae bacterium]
MIRRLGAREAGLALLTALAAMMILQFYQLGLVRGLETSSLDLRFRLRGVVPPGPEVALVMVDDASLKALGRWPFTRRWFVKALDTLDQAGTKVIVFDLLFAEPEEPVPPDLRTAAGAAASEMPADGNEQLRAALRRLAGADPDGEFAAAIKTSGRVLLPVAFSFGKAPAGEPPDLSDWGYVKFDKSPEQPVFPLQPTSAVVPLPRLAQASAGVGHVTIAFDRDGAPRYDYLAIPYNGDFIPSLPVRAAAMYLGVPWSDVGLALGQGVNIGDLKVPTDRGMRLLVNYRGPKGTIPTYSFVDLVQGRLPAQALAGRIVLIGASFIGNADSYASPFGSTQMPGTERMANIIDTILSRDFILEMPPPWPLVAFGAVLALALLMGCASALVPTRAAVLAGAAPLVIWAAGAQLAFLHGLWLPLVQPLAALAAATLVVLLFRYRIVDSEGRQIKSAFRHYLAPDMVNVLASHPEKLKLGGESRSMTLLFCDIRGFTSISETFKANPDGLTHLINRFLTPMTNLIMARQGTIDKYMGDCIMAFWNAPLDDPQHADHACESALAMMRELETINASLEREAAAQNRPFHRLNIGIGLNTGVCVVGNMGSDQRFDYSVLGDAVNLASRLEGQSKTYHVNIVIGEDTRAAAPSWAALELDLIEVKGKHEAVRVYTLLGDAEFARSRAFQVLLDHHDRMIACYRAQDWAAARAALDACRGHDRRMEEFYDLYEERIAHYEKEPPGPDWDGVFVAVSK